MKLTLSELRKWIREEVDRNMRNSAGFYGSGGGGGTHKGSGTSVPGLSPDNQDEEELENFSGEEQEKSQPAVRVASRSRRS